MHNEIESKSKTEIPNPGTSLLRSPLSLPAIIPSVPVLIVPNTRWVSNSAEDSLHNSFLFLGLNWLFIGEKIYFPTSRSPLALLAESAQKVSRSFRNCVDLPKTYTWIVFPLRSRESKSSDRVHTRCLLAEPTSNEPSPFWFQKGRKSECAFSSIILSVP